MHINTKAVHIGQQPDPVTGAVIPPIYMTSSYQQDSPSVTKGCDYTRSNNPNFMASILSGIARLNTAEATPIR